MNYLLSALLITLIIPFWGLLVYLFNKLLYQIISMLTSSKTAMIIVNWLTFPGVIHHECSHALLAFLTGAKITEFRPFWPDKRTGSLGHVNFVARGPFLIKCLQYTLTSSAPVILGTLTPLLLYGVFQNNSMPLYAIILLFYLMISIILHASMSFADVKVMIKGIWVLYFVIYIICLYLQLDVIQMLSSTFHLHF